MLWVTRPRPHIDRAASAWLIRRFVDPEARFAFAADLEAAGAVGGTPFDMRGADLGHHGGLCTFDALLDRYGLDDPALREIAVMVREIDLDLEPVRTPEAHGLDAIIRGLALIIEDDHRLLASTDQLFDGLLAWLQSEAR